jgi:hypothetical protein
MYNLFIGRYQSPHVGHQEIFSTYLDKGLPVLIAVRDTPTDENNPLTAEQVKGLWEKVYADNPLVKVIVIPDIASVNYGRGVGYDVNEIKVSSSIGAISATEIREQIRKGEKKWMMNVDFRIWEDLKNLFTNGNFE